MEAVEDMAVGLRSSELVELHPPFTSIVRQKALNLLYGGPRY